MPIVFNLMSNDQTSGTNKAELGRGTTTTAGVGVQGFYMSWVNVDHHVNVIEATTSAVSVTEEDGVAYARYNFRCEMIDSSGHHTNDNRLLSVVIANLV